nr:PfkB family carbohydrate kinase [Agarivorans sp. B2Z047]
MNQGQWREAIPESAKVVSTVGAGDTFVASFCWACSQQMPPEQKLKFTTAMSALAVSQIGVGVPSQDQLQATLETTQFAVL